MNLLKSFSRKPRLDENSQRLLALYKATRETTMGLSQKLLKSLPGDVVNEGARKLGMLVGKTIVFDSEDEAPVLFDYCIHNVRRGRLNAVDRLFEEDPPEEGSAEWAALETMQRSEFRVVVVESVIRGLGAHVRDVMTDDEFLLVDVALSEGADPGYVVATRLFFFEEFAITGGASVPIVGLPDNDEKDYLREVVRIVVSAHSLADPGSLLKLLLERMHSSREGYPAGESSFEQPRIYSKGRANKIGRNDPCPCGSGRKFKHCCIRRM